MSWIKLILSNLVNTMALLFLLMISPPIIYTIYMEAKSSEHITSQYEDIDLITVKSLETEYKDYVLNTVKHDRVVHGIIEAELAGLKWRVDLVVFILHRNLNNTRVRSGGLKNAFRAFKIIEIEIVVQLLLLVPSKFIRFFHILKINIIYLIF